MTRADDRELLRRLADERRPGGAAERTGGEGRDPGRAAEHARLAALWASLEPPAAASPPPGFTGRVMARVRDAAMRAPAPRRDTLTRRLGAVPARLAAASALAAGLVAGAGLGVLVAAPGARPDGPEAHLTAAADARAAGGGGSAAPGGSPAVAGAVDEETLLAAAVAAATGAGTGEGEGSADDGGPGAPFGAEPDLADGYLAALAALEEAS